MPLFYDLKDKFDLVDYLILHWSALTRKTIEEAKTFGKILIQKLKKTKEKYFIDKVKEKIRLMETGTYNNLYFFLLALEKVFCKRKFWRELFIKELTDYYDSRNGFVTCDMFKDSVEFDIPYLKEKY